MMDKILQLVLVCTLMAFATAGFTAGGEGGYQRSGKLEPFLQLIDSDKYQQAIDLLATALKEKPDDADLLNLYAFSHRKLGRFDVAMETYLKALSIEPEHRGANEYLGELYLQLGQLDKARERLAVLDDACFFGCAEYDELEQAIIEYLRENPS